MVSDQPFWLFVEMEILCELLQCDLPPTVHETVLHADVVVALDMCTIHGMAGLIVRHSMNSVQLWTREVCWPKKNNIK